MAATIRTTVFLALATTFLAIGSTQAQAQPPQQRLLLPPGGGYPTPHLGFDSYFAGNGEQVTDVHYGGPAHRIGLEPGDTIVAVNGVRLRYDGHWYQLVRRAAYQGHVTLAIRDWRSGQLAYRTIPLGGGNPIRPKSGVRRGGVERTLDRLFRQP